MISQVIKICSPVQKKCLLNQLKDQSYEPSSFIKAQKILSKEYIYLYIYLKKIQDIIM